MADISNFRRAERIQVVQRENAWLKPLVIASFKTQDTKHCIQLQLQETSIAPTDEAPSTARRRRRRRRPRRSSPGQTDDSQQHHLSSPRLEQSSCVSYDMDTYCHLDHSSSSSNLSSPSLTPDPLREFRISLNERLQMCSLPEYIHDPEIDTLIPFYFTEPSCEESIHGFENNLNEYDINCLSLDEKENEEEAIQMDWPLCYDSPCNNEHASVKTDDNKLIYTYIVNDIDMSGTMCMIQSDETTDEDIGLL